MNRRRFLALASGVVVAGCSSAGSSEETPSSGSSPAITAGAPSRTTTEGREAQGDAATPTQDETELEDVSTTAVASPETGEPLAVPGTAQLTGHRWPADYAHRGYTSGVVGQVENIGSDRLAEIYVEANFLDGSGTIIGERWDAARFIRPGEFHNIHLPYADDASSDRVAEYELVLSASTEPITQLNSGQVDVTEQQWGMIDDTTYGVSGTATNVTEDRLRSVILTVNFYDGDHLLYQRKDKVSRIGAGQSFEWDVGYYREEPLPDAVSDYTLTVQIND